MNEYNEGIMEEYETCWVCGAEYPQYQCTECGTYYCKACAKDTNGRCDLCENEPTIKKIKYL